MNTHTKKNPHQQQRLSPENNQPKKCEGLLTLNQSSVGADEHAVVQQNRQLKHMGIFLILCFKMIVDPSP